LAVAIFVCDYAVVFLIAGTGMVGLSFIVPGSGKEERRGNTMDDVEMVDDVLLPKKWNEDTIAIHLEGYKDDQGLLSKYIGHLYTRFIKEQETKTAQKRIEFLETFNKYAAVARETYKWHRTLHGPRASREEDALDHAAEAEALRKQTEAEKAKAEYESVTLDRDITRLEKEIKKTELQNRLAELKNPGSRDTGPKKRTKADVNADIAAINAEDQKIDNDPAMKPEEKMRRKNINAKKRESLFEELEKMEDRA
jgi:hypothetical protein